MCGMMKRILSAAAVTAAVFLLGSGEAWGFRPARPFKFDVSVTGGAGAPNHHVSLFEDNYRSFSYTDRYTVAEMYSKKLANVEFSGLYSLLFEVRLAKRITVGGEAMVSKLTGDMYYGFSDTKAESVSSYAVYIMPEFRFYYYMTRLTSMSGAVCAGAGFFQDCANKVSPEYQIKPLAFTIGGRLYAKGELSFGSVFNGVNLGIGYKF